MKVRYTKRAFANREKFSIISTNAIRRRRGLWWGSFISESVNSAISPTRILLCMGLFCGKMDFPSSWVPAPAEMQA